MSESLPTFEVAETTLVCAFRYALGRRTGATTHMVNELALHWDRLTPQTREQIKREIRLAGKDCAMETWGRVLQWDNNICPQCDMPHHVCLCSHEDDDGCGGHS